MWLRTARVLLLLLVFVFLAQLGGRKFAVIGEGEEPAVAEARPWLRWTVKPYKFEGKTNARAAVLLVEPRVPQEDEESKMNAAPLPAVVPEPASEADPNPGYGDPGPPVIGEGSRARPAGASRPHLRNFDELTRALQELEQSQVEDLSNLNRQKQSMESNILSGLGI